MPTTLQIKDFGPLKLVNIELKKFNIIIGPQSSGKSCILKVAAFCKYVECLICSRRSGQVEDELFIKKRLIDYYKLNGFINIGRSEIMYNSDRCKIFISFSNNKSCISYIEKTNALYESDVRYIPAERNVVSTVSDLLNLYRLLPNNISSHYVSDWNTARQNVDRSNSLNILDLGMSYYYDKNKEQDILIVDNDTEIGFVNASSGLQSVVPICLLINYYLSPKSQGDNSTDKQLKDLLDSNDLTNETKEQLRRLLVSSSKKDKEALPCNIFLEEPEISIFPETQYELVKWIVNRLSLSGEDNSIFIATHSPYILSSFNNLIQAYNAMVSNPQKAKIIAELLQTNKYIDFSELSVYEVLNGCVSDIKDYELHLINANGIDSVSDIIQSQYSKLLDYEED